MHVTALTKESVQEYQKTGSKGRGLKASYNSSYTSGLKGSLRLQGKSATL
jgi:hypothetical protein